KRQVVVETIQECDVVLSRHCVREQKLTRLPERARDLLVGAFGGSSRNRGLLSAGSRENARLEPGAPCVDVGCDELVDGWLVALAVRASEVGELDQRYWRVRIAHDERAVFAAAERNRRF